jgi:biopolymer transport protein ExbD
VSVSLGESSQDAELNLAPIIDCFTVLITYLLVTASFLSLAAVDVGVSATGTGDPPPPDSAPPPMVLALEIKASGTIGISLRGGTQTKEITYTVDAKAGVWDASGLAGQLQSIVQKWPNVAEVSVSAEPTVIYKDIVKLIQQIQTVMPKVFISG